MSGIRTRLNRLFAAENREIRATLADTIAVMISSFVVWTALITALVIIDDYTIDGNLVEALFTLAGLNVFPTAVLSLVAMGAIDLFKFRSAPAQRSKVNTALAIVVAMITTTIAAMLLFHIEHTALGLLIAFTACGLCGIPAAIRVTSQTAFVRNSDSGSVTNNNPAQATSQA